MAIAHKNPSADQSCPHQRARDNVTRISGAEITQRICTQCRRVIDVQIIEPPAAAEPVAVTAALEDSQYPAYWDCAPDISEAHGLKTFRRLGWTLIGACAVFIAIAAELI